MIIALMIGRGNSKGFLGKNIYKVLGKLLTLYPMRVDNIHRSRISCMSLSENREHIGIYWFLAFSKTKNS